MSFNPRNRTNTTLPSSNSILWILYQARLHLKRLVPARAADMNRFCRECFTDLRQVPDGSCPVCGTWFDARDPGTFQRSDDAVARLWNRFRHVCLWRGVFLAAIPLVYGFICIVSQHTYLPGAGSTLHTGHRLLELHGAPAIAMGIAWLGVATALHSKYFWGHVDPIWRIADLGVIAGIAAIALGWGYALFHAINWTIA